MLGVVATADFSSTSLNSGQSLPPIALRPFGGAIVRYGGWSWLMVLPPGSLISLDIWPGSRGEPELYPGVHYGFAFPQRRVYDKLAAERHWERLIALYRRRLG